MKCRLRTKMSSLWLVKTHPKVTGGGLEGSEFAVIAPNGPWQSVKNHNSQPETSISYSPRWVAPAESGWPRGAWVARQRGQRRDDWLGGANKEAGLIRAGVLSRHWQTAGPVMAPWGHNGSPRKVTSFAFCQCRESKEDSIGRLNTTI